MPEGPEPAESRQEAATTRIAKRMAQDAGQPEALWELFLLDAYREYYGLQGPATTHDPDPSDMG